MDVLRHRVAITCAAEPRKKTIETVIQKIFDELPVPVMKIQTFVCWYYTKTNSCGVY